MQSKKDIVYLMIPALLTALVYFTVVDGKLRKEMEEILAPTGQLPDMSGHEAAIRRYQHDNSVLRKEVADLTGRKTQSEEALKALLGPMSDGQRRDEEMRAFRKVLESHRLGQLSEQPSDAAALPEALRFLTDFIKKQGYAKPPEARVFTVGGGYLDMLAALEDLSKRGIQVIPVNLSWKPVESGAATRIWTLLVWV